MFVEALPFAPRFEIFPASADSFFTLSGEDVIFTRDRAGRGVKLTLDGQVATRAR